jgi:hypothetical protein
MLFISYHCAENSVKRPLNRELERPSLPKEIKQGQPERGHDSDGRMDEQWTGDGLMRPPPPAVGNFTNTRAHVLVWAARNTRGHQVTTFLSAFDGGTAP